MIGLADMVGVALGVGLGLCILTVCRISLRGKRSDPVVVPRWVFTAGWAFSLGLVLLAAIRSVG